MTPLHYFDSAIQLARNSARELTEEEFEVGMNAANQIEKRLRSYYIHLNMGSCFFVCLTRSLNECRLEMLEPDSTIPLLDDS